MLSLEPGTPAPPFSLRNQRGEEVSTSGFLGARTMLVFIPFAFTRVCEGELCQIRDELDLFRESGVRVVAITCDSIPTNRAWAEGNGFGFDILSDFWPHGEVSRLYDTFDDTAGYARRTTYLIDEDGIIREVISSEELKVPRPFDAYRRVLSAG